jgi:hypothetical protein
VKDALTGLDASAMVWSQWSSVPKRLFGEVKMVNCLGSSCSIEKMTGSAVQPSLSWGIVVAQHEV